MNPNGRVPPKSRRDDATVYPDCDVSISWEEYKRIAEAVERNCPRRWGRKKVQK